MQPSIRMAIKNLREYLDTNNLDLDDCIRALGDKQIAKPWIAAVRSKYKFNNGWPNKKWEVLVFSYAVIDDVENPQEGAWVSAWIWVPSSEAVKHRLLETQP